MTGPFVARETIGLCMNCKHTFRSEALQRLVPKYCNVAFDLLVFIGQALFRRHRTVDEICDELTNSLHQKHTVAYNHSGSDQ